jgi:tetratricopeptide (TPR) repeat protein
MSLAHLLAFIRMSRHDPAIVEDCREALVRGAERAPAALREALVRAVHEAWDNHFPIGESRDLAFGLASLLYAHGDFAGALGLFEQSRLLHGDDPRKRWNQGLCHTRLREPEEAARCFAEALAMAPDFQPAAQLLTKDWPE